MNSAYNKKNINNYKISTPYSVSTINYIQANSSNSNDNKKSNDLFFYTKNMHDEIKIYTKLLDSLTCVRTLLLCPTVIKLSNLIIMLKWK
jgi:hypothetical protein